MNTDKLNDNLIELLEKVKNNQLSKEEEQTLAEGLLNSEAQGEIKTSDVIYYRNEWLQEDLGGNIDARGLNSILLFDHDRKLFEKIRNKDNTNVVLVLSGSSYRQLEKNIFEMNSGDAEAYVSLLNHLKERNIPMDAILHNWSEDAFSSETEAISRKLNLSIYSIFHITKTLIQQGLNNKIKFLFLHRNNATIANPLNKAVIAFGKAIKLENPHLSFKVMEMEGDTCIEEGYNDILKELMVSGDREVSYKDGVRYVSQLRETELKEQRRHQSPLRENGVYLITGGFGGLGRIFTKYITSKGNNHIILTGRSKLNQEKEALLSNLNNTGSQVTYIQSDINNWRDVVALVKEIKSRWGQLNGILHCAGVVRDSFLIKKTKEEMAEVIASKIYGTVYLDEATKKEDLDFFLMFSSSAATLGNAGQSDYAFGNGFLDQYAPYRRLQGRKGRSLSINWPIWRDGGMKVDPQIMTIIEKNTGMIPLEEDVGIKTFENAIEADFTNLGVLQGNIEKIRSFLDETKGIIKNREGSEDMRKISIEKLREKTELYLKEILVEEIKLPINRIKSNELLEKYGIDSVMIINLNDKLQSHFGELSKTLLYEYQSIEELVEYFIKYHQDQLVDKFAEDGYLQQPQVTIPVETPKEIAGTKETKTPQVEPVEEHRRNRFGKPKKTTTKNSQYKEEDIAVIGLSGKYPMAKNIDEFWENLKAGKDCISEIPEDRWDHSKYFHEERGKLGKSYSKWGGFIDEVDRFDPLFFNISPKEAETIDPQERVFLETVWNTLEDAGYTKSRLYGGNVGVFVGVMYGHYQLFGAEESLKGNPTVLPGSYSSIANRISYFFNFHGPSLALDTMCSSSLTTIHLACESIKRGESEMAIAGGVNLTLHPAKYLLLSQNNFVSSDGRCRSFGEGGDGYVPGEGVGAVMLKSLSKAIEDGDRIYAIIKGSSLNHGGKTNGYTVPNPNAQSKLIADALKRSNINPRTISYMEAHGTGTSLGDPIEITGLMKAFGEYTQDRQYCAIGSVKSNIGHLESAAGIAGVTKLLLQLKYKKIVSSLHSDILNPNINFENSPFKVQRELTDWEPMMIDEGEGLQILPRRAGISGFGAGGSNAHIIFEEYIEEKEPMNKKSLGPQVIVLSAKNQKRLMPYVENMVGHLKKKIQDKNTMELEGFDLENLAYTLQVGREAMEERLAFVASNIKEVINRLEEYLKDPEGSDELFVGNIKGNKSVANLLLEGREGEEFLKVIVMERKLLKLAQLWVSGIDVQWSMLYQKEKGRVLSLPNYPFERKRYWIPQIDMDLLANETIAATALDGPATNQAKSVNPKMVEDHRLFIKSWKATTVEEKMNRLQGKYLLLVNGQIPTALMESLQNQGNLQWVVVKPKELQGIAGENVFEIDFEDKDNPKEIVSKILKQNPDIKGLMDLSDLLDLPVEKITDDQGKLRFLQEVIKNKINEPFTILHLTKNLVDFKNNEISLQGACFSGLIRLLSYEYPKIEARTVDIDHYPEGEGQLLELFNKTLAFGRNVVEICIRKGLIYTPYLKKLGLEKLQKNGTPQNLRPLSDKIQSEKVYVVTGGTSGIGYEMAKHLAKQGVKKLVLMGYTPIPERRQWDSLLDSKQEKIEKKIRALKKIEEMGVELAVYSGVLSDEEKLKGFFGTVRKQMGPIGGVIHSAAAPFNDTPHFINKKIEDIVGILEPKLSGTMTLAKVLKEEPIDFFISFSSVASAIPSRGGGNCHYAMANHFLDNFTSFMNSKGHHQYRCVNWVYWGDTGGASSKEAKKALEALGIYPITNEEGLKLFDRVLDSRLPRILAGKLSRKLLSEMKVDFDRITLEYEDATDSVNGLATKEVQREHDHRVAGFGDLRESYGAFKHYSSLLLLKALRRMGMFSREDEVYSIKVLKSNYRILDQYNRLFNAIISILEEANYLQQKEGMIETTAYLFTKEVKEELENIEEVKNSLLKNYPDFTTSVKFLEKALERYDEILTGKVAATDVLFPQGSMELVEGLYKNNNIADYLNDIIAQYSRAYIRNRIATLKANEKINILEIGAGTGSTSGRVLEAIKEYGEYISYCYTDISKGFVNYGIKNYQQKYPFTEFKVLDIEKNVEKQGYGMNHFDMIIATNVIHATELLSNTLNQSRRLLKHKGVFLLNEVTTVQDFLTLTFGLLEGWWRFEDEVIRLEHSPLLSQEGWRDIFKEMEFETEAIYGIPFTPNSTNLIQSVMVGVSNGFAEIEEITSTEGIIERTVGAVEHQPQKTVVVKRKVKKSISTNPEEAIKTFLKAVLSELLKIEVDQIEEDTSFGEYGLDSIVTGSFVEQIEAKVNDSLNPAVIIENDNLNKLSKHLSETYGAIFGEEIEEIEEIEEVEEIAEVEETKVVAELREAESPQPQQIIPREHQPRVIDIQSPNSNKIAVIGMACHFPQAKDKESYWQNLIMGKDCITEIPSSRWDIEEFYSPQKEVRKTNSKWGGFIEGIEEFDPQYFKINEQEAYHLDPLIRQIMESSVQALRDAGYDRKDLWKRKVGVFIGSRTADYRNRIDRYNKASITGIAQNFIAAHISHFFNFTGPCLVVDSACSSSLVSIHLACQSLKMGESEVALAGGVDILLDEGPYLLLGEMGALSPDGKCHTFDQRANGFVPGEGSGAVILKKLDKAIEDGDRIYAVIDATAVNNDGNTMGITTPNPEAQAEVIRDALYSGNINPSTIGYVETHGTGTLIGDPIELKSLTKIFSEYTEEKQFCGVGSVKTNIGHLLSAAGVASFIKVVLSIMNKKIPPTLNCSTPNPRFEFSTSPFYLNREAREWNPRNGKLRAGISSFGLGGTNACVIVGDFDSTNYQATKKPLPPLQFNRKRYWIEKTYKPEQSKEIDVIEGILTLKKSSVDTSNVEDTKELPSLLSLEKIR